MSQGSRVLLEQRGVRITEQEATFAGGTVALGRIEQAWVVTRRPGLGPGALLAVVGAALLLRGAGPARLLGVALVGYGVYLARRERHELMLRVAGVPAPQEALRSQDGFWAREVLRELTRARGLHEPGSVRDTHGNG
jgi:hypothetical protein